MSQHVRAERFRVPTFDNDDRSDDAPQVSGTQYGRQRLLRGLRLWIEDQEIDLGVLSLRASDELSLLPNEKSVQLEELADVVSLTADIRFGFLDLRF